MAAKKQAAVKKNGTLYQIYRARAEMHCGGRKALDERLLEVKPKVPAALKRTPDDRYLAEMAACIFRAGFVWRVVAAKWEGFEQVFNGFIPLWVASRSPEQIEAMASDERIIRNMQKVKAVQDNATFMLDIQREHGSFGQFIADWPEDDMVGLFKLLKLRGSRLGGNSAQYFLRFMGKDTFIFSNDVSSALHLEGVTSKATITSQKDQNAAQAAFNDMREESGKPLCVLSRMLALSVG